MEEVENGSRIHSARMQRIEQRLESLEEKIKGLPESLTGKDGSKGMETTVKEILETTEELKESIQNSVKEEMKSDQINDREKMQEERKQSLEKSLDCNNNTALTKTASCENELAADRIPNALEPDDSPISVDRQGDVRFIDRATSPVKLMHSKFEVKRGSPTDDELEQLGDEIAEKWEKLGRRLAVGEARLREISQANDQLSEKGYQMLKHWKQNKGSAATYQALCDALQHKLLQRQDLVEKFCYKKGKEVAETELNRVRIRTARVQQIVSDMTFGLERRLETLEENVESLLESIKKKVGNTAMEKRVQEILESTVQQLKDMKESFENSMKEVEVEETELRKECDQMDDRERIPEERKQSLEKSSDCNNNTALNKTASCEKTPNALEPDDSPVSPGTQENVRFIDRATSPVKLMQSKFEEKKNKEGKLRELEQEIENLKRQKNGIELQLCNDKHRIKEELVISKEKLEDHKTRLTTAVRQKKRLKTVNGQFVQKIEELEKRNKALVTRNKDLMSKINEDRTTECENLRAERDQFISDIKRLRNEVDESQLKCRTLEEEIIKWRHAVSRVFLPSGKDFSKNSAGVVSALKKDVSAFRSSDGPGEARDIFDHKNAKESGTDARRNSWWCVDLGENNRLFITHCALRHGKKDGEAILVRWRLEGSIDGRMWTDLKTGKDPNDDKPFSAPHPYYTGRWTVEGEVGAFRYFRIWQTGRNSSSTYGIYLSGVEFYGRLVKA